MRYPNLRYGNPTELAYYCMGRSTADVATMLRRDERTVRDWLSGRSKLPWWVPEILRLKRMEGQARAREMNMPQDYPNLGIVRADVLQLHRPAETNKPLTTDQRLADVDQPGGAVRNAGSNTRSA